MKRLLYGLLPVLISLLYAAIAFAREERGV